MTYPIEVRETAEQMIKEGKRYVDVARALNLSKGILNHWFGPSTQRTAYTPEFKQQVKQRVDAGDSYADIARDLNISTRTLQRWFGPSVPPVPHYPQETVLTAFRLLSEGTSCREVSESLNVPLDRVYTWRRKYVMSEIRTRAIALQYDIATMSSVTDILEKTLDLCTYITEVDM